MIFWWKTSIKNGNFIFDISPGADLRKDEQSPKIGFSITTVCGLFIGGIFRIFTPHLKEVLVNGIDIWSFKETVSNDSIIFVIMIGNKYHKKIKIMKFDINIL